jgi:hypothetical protein
MSVTYHPSWNILSDGSDDGLQVLQSVTQLDKFLVIEINHGGSVIGGGFLTSALYEYKPEWRMGPRLMTARSSTLLDFARGAKSTEDIVLHWKDKAEKKIKRLVQGEQQQEKTSEL